MYTSTLLTLALASLALSQESGVYPISQIPDGQVQAPTAPVAPATTSAPYENPFTAYLTETDSLGVITGHPSVVTSQPAVVTEQPISPTLPSYSGYAYGNSTTVGVVASTLSTVTSATDSPTVPPTSASASPPIAQATGGAEMNRVAGCGVALVLLGLGFTML